MPVKASLIAPLLAPVLYVLIGFLYAWLNHYQHHNLLGSSLIVLVISYAMTLLFGLPAYLLLKKHHLFSTFRLTVIGLILGALFLLSFFQIISSSDLFEFNDLYKSLQQILLGGFFGGAVAFTFAQLARITTPQQ